MLRYCFNIVFSQQHTVFWVTPKYFGSITSQQYVTLEEALVI